MNVAIIDADLIGRKKHRFPNLASMKISSYYKSLGYNVELKTDYNDLTEYDKIFISKVFTDTPIDADILKLPNVEYGGTGFFFDKAPNLPDAIEHSIPDYHLYDDWVQSQINKGFSKTQFKDYLDCSIGFTTRGCFRKCEFCVNKKYNNSLKHSPVSEFLDVQKKYISLWDDNFLAYPKWREILEDLKATGKPFRFRQGLDLRLITREKAIAFKDVKYQSDFIFAFDNIEDRKLIEEKLKIWKEIITRQTVLYVFCGYDRHNNWNKKFWLQDIVDTFERIKILMKYGCIPYIMRFNRYEESPYRGIYITLARWCNQPNFYKKKSLRDYAYNTKGVGKSAKRYLDEFENKHPEIASKYYDLRFEDINEYNKKGYKE